MKPFKNKALIICSIILSASIVLCSCGAKSESAKLDGGMAKPSSSLSQENKASSINNSTGVTKDQASATSQSANDSGKKEAKVNYENIQTSGIENRKIVKSSSLIIETKTYDKAIEALNEKLNKASGYVENSSETGSGLNNEDSFKNRSAKFVLRIPKQNYEAFITDAGNIGNVINKTNIGEDITSQYFDTEAHLKTLKVKEERILELLKKTGDLKDILTLETELNNTRYEIESLTGSLKRWDNMVDYSTVSIVIQEVKELTEIKETPTTFLGKIKNSFKYSCKAILNITKGTLIGFFALLPFLPIIVILYFIIRFIYKRNKNKYTSSKQKE